MEVHCTTTFDLSNSEHHAIATQPDPNRDDLVNWLKLLPIKARIHVDYASRAKLVAYWTEER